MEWPNHSDLRSKKISEKWPKLYCKKEKKIFQRWFLNSLEFKQHINLFRGKTRFYVLTLFPTITASVLTLIPYSPTSYPIRYSTEPHFGSKNFAKVTLTLNWLTPNYEKMETMHFLFLNSCLQAHWLNLCALALQIQKQNGCEPDLKVRHKNKKNPKKTMGNG